MRPGLLVACVLTAVAGNQAIVADVQSGSGPNAGLAVVNGREHVVNRTLAELEGILDPRRFLRVHRSTIVNVAAVQEIERSVDDGVIVRLKDDRRTELPVARERVKDLRRNLGL
jgi:DNA-binding LytR/AlgR family response regulator